MIDEKCCAKCLSAKDFAKSLRHGETNDMEWFRPTFGLLQNKIGWLRQEQFSKPGGIVESIVEFQGLKELNGKNEIIDKLVEIFRAKPSIREDIISYLFLLMIPLLKKIGCHYCKVIMPVYDPFSEAYFGAYNAIAKGKFKKGDIIMASIIRRVRAHLFRLAQKEGKLNRFRSIKSIEEIEQGLDKDDDWE
jgi:thiol-disulfide isomerase/thioredoxin